MTKKKPLTVLKKWKTVLIFYSYLNLNSNKKNDIIHVWHVETQIRFSVHTLEIIIIKTCRHCEDKIIHQFIFIYHYNSDNVLWFLTKGRHINHGTFGWKCVWSWDVEHGLRAFILFLSIWIWIILFFSLSKVAQGQYRLCKSCMSHSLPSVSYFTL
jgi:hypothetical protein